MCNKTAASILKILVQNCRFLREINFSLTYITDDTLKVLADAGLKYLQKIEKEYMVKKYINKKKMKNYN